MTADELRTLVAAWGAITGTVGLTIGIMALLRDRSRLRLVVSEVVHDKARLIHTELARFDHPSFIFVEAINIGRRVRYVYQPEMWRAGEHGLLLHDNPYSVFFEGSWSLSLEPWQTWRLEEGQSVTFVFPRPTKARVVRIDLPDSLARTSRYLPLSGRFRWYYGRWKGGKGWKVLRDMHIERRRTRHHDLD